jgi:hypothetical protein
MHSTEGVNKGKKVFHVVRCHLKMLKSVPTVTVLLDLITLNTKAG